MDEIEERRQKRLQEILRRENAVLEKIRAAAPQLRLALERANGHWGYEDGMYRFYYGSFKVYNLQAHTHELVEALKACVPEGRELSATFQQVIAGGTGRKFEMSVNERWGEETIPITVAFLHARYFVEMAVKYSEMTSLPDRLPSGWAALLCLVGLR